MASADIPSLALLTPEARQRLLGELLQELTSRDSSVVLEVEGTAFHVYRPPVNALEIARRTMLAQSTDHRDEMNRRAKDSKEQAWSPEAMLQMVTADPTHPK